MYEVGVARTFHAAHQLEETPSAAEDHEHDYRVEVVVRGQALNESGMVLDLDHLGSALDACLAHLESARLDSLSDFAGESTTVEMVAQHVWDHVRLTLTPSSPLESLRVTVHESPIAWATVDMEL